MQTKSASIGEPFSDKEKNFWSVWINTLKINSNYMDFQIATLCKASDRDSKGSYISISISDLQKAYKLISKQLQKNLLWVIKESINLLSPFVDYRQHKVLNYSKSLIEKIRKLQNFVMKRYPNLITDEFFNLGKNFSLLQELEELLIELSSKKRKNNVSIYQLNSLNDSYPTIQSLKFIIKLLKRVENQEEKKINIDDFLTKYVNNKGNSVEFGLWSIKELQKSLDFFKALRESFILFDCYVYSFFINQCEISKALSKWSENLKKNKTPKQYQEIIRSLYAPQPSAKTLLKDLLVGESAMQKTTKKAGKKKRKKKTKIKQQVICSNSKLKETASKQIVKEKKLSSSVLDKSQSKQIYHLFSEKMEGFTRDIEKIAFRQAALYYFDLQVSLKQIASIQINTTKAFRVFTNVIWSSYHLLEQSLRLKNILSNSKSEKSYTKHNLKWLAKPLSLDQESLKIIYQVYLANYWIRETYEHHQRWEAMFSDYEETPQMLRTIYEVSEGITKINQEFLLNIANKTFTAVHKTLNLSIENHSFSIPNEQTQIDVRFPDMTLIKKQCTLLLNQIPGKFEHLAYLKLKQIIKHLDLLLGYYENSQSIQKSFFSLFVRDVIFWNHKVLEEFLKILVFNRLGREIHTHDLKFLSNICFGKTFSHDAISNFSGVSRIARYPYELSFQQSNLHKLILKAEYLRENPLSEGFQIAGNSLGTKLNFIPIINKNVSYKKIMQELSLSVNRAVDLIEKKILPLLEKQVQAFASGVENESNCLATSSS